MELLWDLPSAQDTERLGAFSAGALPLGIDLDRSFCCFFPASSAVARRHSPRHCSSTLGVAQTVRSRTYALIELYSIRRTAEDAAAGHSALAVHVDLYRLRGAEEIVQLGLRITSTMRRC